MLRYLKAAFVESRRRLLRARYSQYGLIALVAVVSGYLVAYLLVLIRLLGWPAPISAIVALVVLIGLPYYLIRGLTRLWTLDAQDFAASHPSRFLAKVREIHRSAIIIELMGVILAVILVGNLRTGPELSDVLAYASANLSLVEFVVMGSIINFWHPDPYYALLASLDSETDAERNQKDTWLDGSLEWFNALLSSRRSKVVLRSDLNLEALLFDPTYRQLSISVLHLAAKSNTQRFIEEVSNLMHKYPSEILERNSRVWKAKTHLDTLLSISLAIVGILIALSPILIRSLQQLIQSWFSLFG